MIQLIIFDMAGTAVYEDNLVYKTIQSVLIKSGYPVSLDEVLESGAGKEKRKAISDILESQNYRVSEEDIDNIHAEFRKELDQAYQVADIRLFDDVKKLVPRLRKAGVKVAFNTGYKREMAEFILDKCQVSIPDDIDLLIASDDVIQGRPHPDMIIEICDRLRVSTDETVKIGDSAIDIIEGKNAQVKYTIGITTGAQTSVQLEAAHPDYIVDSVAELPSLLSIPTSTEEE